MFQGMKSSNKQIIELHPRWFCTRCEILLNPLIWMRGFKEKSSSGKGIDDGMIERVFIHGLSGVHIFFQKPMDGLSNLQLAINYLDTIGAGFFM